MEELSEINVVKTDSYNAIDNAAYVLGTDEYGISLAKRLMNSLNIEYIEEIEDVETPNLLVFACQYPEEKDLTLLFKKIKMYIESIQNNSNSRGRIVVITNGFEKYKCTEESINSFVVQQAIEAFFKQIALMIAPKFITCNFIEIGYFEERDGASSISNFDTFFRRQAVRRAVSFNDIKCTMSFLLSESSRYITGESIVLDGGLEMNQVTPPIKIAYNKNSTFGAFSTNYVPNENKYDLSGKVAIIFGCSSGIGKATAIELFKRGADVSLVSRRKEKLEELQLMIDKKKQRSLVLQKDVRNQMSVEDAIEETWDFFGKIDIFVYVAGVGYTTDELDDDSDYMNMYETNYLAYSRTLKKLFQKWRNNKINGVGVGVSTVDVKFVPSYGLAAYSVTKAAMTQLTKNFSLLGAKYGIRLNCVAPGYIDTEIMNFTTESYRKQWCEKIPMGRLGNAEDISGVICFLVSSASEYIIGKNITVDGGYSLIKIPEILQS